MRSVRRLLVCLVLLTPSLIIAPIATAAPTKGITISPFLQDVRIQADNVTKRFDLSLTNNTTKEQTLRLTVIDFGSLNDTGGVIFAGSNENGLIAKYGLANWLKVDTPVITVDGGKTAKIQATIVNDDTMQPGGHYAAIVASVDSPDDSAASKVAIDQQLSSLIFATKIGGEKYDLKLDSVRPQSSHFGLPTTVTLHFSNPGNVHVVPRGTIRVLGSHDKVISQGIINEESGFILPETSRKLIVAMHGVSRTSWWPGTYKLQVQYRYDGYDNYATKTFTFSYLNLPALALIAALFIGLLIIAYWQLHKHNFKLKNVKLLRSLFRN